MKKLILASKSPRRKEILATCGYPFECIPADIEEVIDENKNIIDAIKEIAKKKALAIYQDNEEAVVIGSDTVVVVDNIILGKPKNREEAKKMLKMLSNNTHQVITGLCIVSKEECYEDYSISNVTFMDMSEAEIEEYVNSKECDDKAGAYAIQGLGGKYISNIEGDYYAIMGLPINKVYMHLRKVL